MEKLGKDKMNNKIANGLLILVSVLLSILLLEFALRIAIDPRPSGVGKGILAKEYFSGLNLIRDRFGFRNPDEKWKKKYFDYLFIGDSFTFGHGVNGGENFSSVFERMILNSGAVNVLNLGQSGSNTQQQIQILERFFKNGNNLHFGKSYVVYQYFGNDVEYLGDVVEENYISFVDMILSYLMDYSYLVDFIYHKRYLTVISGGNYLNFLEKKYSDPIIFCHHENDVRKIYQMAHERGGKVVFVPFPFLWNGEMVDISKKLYLDKMKSVFDRFCTEGDGFFDVAELLNASGMSPDEWVVNPVDAHPSAKLHRLIGSEIFDSLSSSSPYVLPCGQ